jgi:hypothetical protein
MEYDRGPGITEMLVRELLKPAAYKQIGTEKQPRTFGFACGGHLDPHSPSSPLISLS